MKIDNSMKTVSDIKALSSDARRNLDRMEKEIANVPYRDLATVEYEQKAAAINIEKTYLKILHDNARRAYVNEKLPIVLAVINEWVGKPCGDKTRAKINDETKLVAGCAVYIHDGGAYSSDDITLVPLDANGYSGNSGFKYDDLKLTVRRTDGGEKGRMFDGEKNNKIVEHTAADFELVWCNEYDPDPTTTAVRIVGMFQAMQKTHKEYEKACAEYNKMIPSGMDSIHTPAPRWYMF
jgi:hypothetical protein